MKNMIYRGRPGEHIATSVENVLLLADRYDREVFMKFNNIKVKVNKRLSIKHIVNTYNAMIEAGRIRWQKSPEFKQRQIDRQVRIVTNQDSVNKLVESPVNKYEYGLWLSEYIDVVDLLGVNSRYSEVIELLKNAGFESEEHVGRDDLRENPKEMLEYVAGQVISTLNHMLTPHPMLGQWAREVHEKLNGEKV